MTAAPGDAVTSHDAFEDRVAAATDPVVVRFGASWSACAARVDPALAAVADDAGTVLRVDVERNPVTAAAHDVVLLPTVLVFRDGAVAARADGARTERDVRALL